MAKTKSSKITSSKKKTVSKKRTTNKAKTGSNQVKSLTGNSMTTINGYFKVKTGLLQVMERNAQKGVNTLLLGPTGVGKTELVSNVAEKLKLPLTIFDMGTMTDPIMSLIGNHVIKMEDGKTSSTFVKSRFSEVIQQPGIVLLDELSRASVLTNNLLFPCLDFRRQLPMEYCFEDADPIKIHPECVFFATANLGGQYTGTHKLDRALMDRFMLIEVEALKKDQVQQSIKYQNPKITATKLEKIVDVFDQINKAHEKFTISFNLSMRHLKMIANLVEDGFSIYDAYYIICKGIASKEGLKSIETILQSAR